MIDFKMDISECSVSQVLKIKQYVLENGSKEGVRVNLQHDYLYNVSNAVFTYNSKSAFDTSKQPNVYADIMLTMLGDTELDEETVGVFPANALKYFHNA